MAHARFARDSDVYVYADASGGFTCERCPRIGETFRCGTAAEMVTHLLLHRANGQRVPDEALDELMRDSNIHDELVDVVFTDDRKYKAEVHRRSDDLFQIWVFREAAEDEYEPETSWLPVGRDAILTDDLERAKALAKESLREVSSKGN